jgi:hypothetical protein
MNDYTRGQTQNQMPDFIQNADIMEDVQRMK